MDLIVMYDKDDKTFARVSWKKPSSTEDLPDTRSINTVYRICWWTDESDKQQIEIFGYEYYLTKLKEGTTYFVSVIKVDNNCPKESEMVKFQTAPNPPSNLLLCTVRAYDTPSISVMFDWPAGPSDFFIIEVRSKEDLISSVKSYEKSALIQNLQSATEYAVSVFSVWKEYCQ
uniref:uncharacterized protein LOC120337163 n=1 Tax=Styela clava TaxID=7725 RepID=UPI00193A2269|nr:uncharacterized protein LOC120337163 [Styela clava]